MARRGHHRVVRGRRLVQLAFFVVTLLIGVRFTLWATALIAGKEPLVARPSGVEGFLPISALMSLRLWLAGGGVHPVHPAALAILLAVLAMSLIMAKSFCSQLCPVGAVSEWLGRLGVRLMGRTWLIPRWLDVPLRSVKYLVLAFFLWATWLAMDLPAVRGFLDGPYNRVADVKLLLFFTHPGRLTIAVLGVLTVSSVLVRDAWYRYLCPYGALLGLVGRLSPLKVTRDPAACTGCGQCTTACPARLPVHAMTRVASVECTSCQDCVAACPVKDCLAVRPPGRRGGAAAVRPAAAVAIAVAVFLAIVVAFRATGYWSTAVTEREYAARLPSVGSPLYDHARGEVTASGENPSAIHAAGTQ